MLYTDFLQERFTHVQSTQVVSGVPPIVLLKSKCRPLKDYSVYGNSTQASYSSGSISTMVINTEADPPTAYFDNSDFLNAYVGMKVNFIIDSTVHKLEVVKIDSNYTYVDNTSSLLDFGQDVTYSYSYPSSDNPIPIQSVGDARLPSEYQEVEYIRSRGAQYIDTDFKGTPNSRLEFKVKNSSSGKTGYAMFGSQIDKNTYFVQRCGTFSGVNNGLNTNTSAFIYSTEQTYLNVDAVYNIDLKNLKATVNEESFEFSSKSGVIDSYFSDPDRPTLYIFANHGPVYVYTPCTMSLYYFKIYDDDVLIRDFVPCYRKSDGVAGIYDLCGSISPSTNTPFYINIKEDAADFTLGTVKNTYKVPLLSYVDQTSPTTTTIYLDKQLHKINTDIDFITKSTNTLTSNINTIDLSTLDWTYDTTNARFYSSAILDIQDLSGENINIYCSKYIGSTAKTDNTMFHTSKVIYIYDSNYTDATLFKASLSNTILYYVLATPITQSIALPNIPTFKGTTILAAGTTTQPSSIMAKYIK